MPNSPSPDPVTSYAEAVAGGKLVTGKLVKLACERHLTDIEKGRERGLAWDLDAANRAIEFFPDVLRLPESNPPNQRFILQPWQQFIIGSLFGWKRADGYRRFRFAYIEVGKGNGKSPMSAGIGLYMLSADGEQGAQCFAAATTREQAEYPFQDAVKMVQASPQLSSRILLSGKRKVFNLAHLASGSFFRPISSEHKSLDGKRIHYAVLDELHEHPNAMVVDKVRAGTKGRRQALIFGITNSGFDRSSVCWSQHDYCRQILEGLVPNDSWFAYVCQLDKGEDWEDDWRDEKVWPKANPNLGISIQPEYLRELVTEALGMPSKQNIVKRLNFCMWTEGSERWMETELWNACKGTYTEADLLGEACYGGLDVAKNTDFAAFVLEFPGKPIKFLPYMWLPELNLQKRAQETGVPLDLWKAQGHLRTTPGNVIDYDCIRRDINELGTKFRINDIAFDPYDATQLSTQLQGDGFTVEPMRQGFLSLGESTASLMRLVKSKGIQHNNNPLFNWMISNVVVAMDAAGNIKIDKARSGVHVDGPAALANANARVIHNPEVESYYESHGLDSIGPAGVGA